jgi:hypothetical protein
VTTNYAYNGFNLVDAAVAVVVDAVAGLDPAGMRARITVVAVEQLRLVGPASRGVLRAVAVAIRVDARGGCAARIAGDGAGVADIALVVAQHEGAALRCAVTELLGDRKNAPASVFNPEHFIAVDGNTQRVALCSRECGWSTAAAGGAYNFSRSA